jgi:hypothetical protein
MTKHKHYDLIMAWADGAAIELHLPDLDRWAKASNPGWYEDCDYRVKQLRTDVVHEVLIVCGTTCGPLLYAASSIEANCVLVFDGETNKLKGCTFKAA